MGVRRDAQQQSREECGGREGYGKEDGARCARVMGAKCEVLGAECWVLSAESPLRFASAFSAACAISSTPATRPKASKVEA